MTRQIDVFPVDWRAGDVGGVDDLRFEITLYGKLRDGRSAVVHINFLPYFFVEVPGHWASARTGLFIAESVRRYRANAAHCHAVSRKTLHGFTNNEKRPFVQVAFNSFADYKRARYAMQRDAKLQTYEAALDPLLKFFHVRNIEPSQWVAIHVERGIVEDAGNFEARVNFGDVATSLLRERPPLVFASWDIECVSLTGKFPNADLPGDKIITIGTAFQRYGEPEPYKRVVVALGTCDDIPGVDVLPCETEGDLLAAWLDVVAAERTDVMVGYNTFGFDLRYLYGRATQCVDDHGEPQVDLSKLGRGPGGGLPLEKNLSSAAYGDNKFFLVTCPGVVQLDLLQIFRKELKLDSYSLANVSKKYLDGHTKIDLSPGDMFKKFDGTAADRAEIAEYCVRDCELPLKLMAKLCVFENLLEMANATIVPIEYLALRGQQIKVYSMLLKKARTLGFVAPDLERAPEPDGKYEGATVLQAKKGAYFDVVSALDFASLYPSIMRAHSMCPSTLVMDDKYAAVEGVEYYDVRVGADTYKFAQNVPCVVPALLEDLAAFRKQAKNDMAAAKERGDPFAAALFNAKQLAYKVSTNSVYGFFGAVRGMFPCVAIAASVTATGRHMIEHSKNLAESLAPGSEVIYGDSVAAYTPILVRAKDESVRGAFYTTFEDLTRNMAWTSTQSGKEVCELGDTTDIWSDAGWTTLQRVIRHKLDPKKRMIRVVTESGLVDVTSDHSLLHPDGQPVTPENVGAGMELMHTDLPIDDMFEVGVTHRELRREYWKTHSTFEPLAERDHLDAAHAFAIGLSLWTGVCLEYRPGVSSLHMKLCPAVDAGNRVVCVREISHPGDAFVYDATTDTHHFAAGIGRMVVHNTDSIFVKLAVGPEKRYDLEEHFRMAEWMAHEISKTFKSPIELEFEKCYYPLMLFTKKRYAALMFTKPDAPDYIDIKGLQLVRRDSPPLIRNVSNAILRKVMHERSTEGAILEAKNAVRLLLTGQVQMEDLVTSKQLRSNYVNEKSQPHVTVARKILARTGAPVTQGERVPYVFVVENENMDGLMASRAEDPKYVAAHGLEIDYLYYLKNQLLSPVTTLLEVLVDDPEAAILDDPQIQETLKILETTRKRDVQASKRVKRNVVNRQYEITSFFKTC